MKHTSTNIPKILIATFISFISCSGYVSSLNSMLKTHENYHILTDEEKNLLNRVLSKIEDSPRQAYYIEKLIDMLNTPYIKSDKKFKSMQRNRLRNSVENEKKILIKRKKSINDATSHKEETLQTKHKSGWIKLRPHYGDPFIWVHRDDPLNILVYVLIYLEGDKESIEEIKFLEDAVEKHLHMDGFSVNVVFVDQYIEDMTSKVKVEHGKWASTYNWTGDKYTLAHELMHILGLQDEYDKIEDHYDNKNLTWEYRLRIFLFNIDKKLPDDALDGIMSHNTNKPLQRHICAIAKLGKDCVEKRLTKYGM